MAKNVIQNHHLPAGVVLRHHRWRLESGEALPFHRHHFAEWFCIDGGSGTQEGPGGQQLLKAGDFWFLPPGSVHRLSASRQGLEWTNVSVSLDTLSIWRQRYADIGDKLFPIQPTRIAPLHGADHSRFQALLLNLNQEETRVSHVDGWFLDLARSLQPREADLPMPTWLRVAMAVLDTPEGLWSGLEAVQEAAGRSPDHLARVMKKWTGTTPALYVRGRRLDHAAKLLRTDTDSVLDVALRCGFDNPSYFAKAFAQRYGVTPKRYRIGSSAIGSEIAS